MIERSLLLIISMLFIITLLTMLSKKLKISYPIFLVIAGLLISLVPGIPQIRITPDFVFLIFLPPILFSAAWNIPWADFWRLKRSISLLGFGLVFFTSIIIAYLSHSLIPGFTLALGFVLGGIISPPDAVAATSVLKDLKIPRNVVSLLEGESLVNDASSLVVFRFALLAVTTGTFNFWNASKDFFLLAGGGILVGLVIAAVIYVIHRYFPTTTAIDAALTLLAPFVMYLVAEHFHFSGVLSVVAGGLFLSYHAHDTLTYESRINVAGLWETLGFLLNGFIFILIGLQMPYIVHNFTRNTVKEALLYGVIISIAVIIIRILWVYVVTHLRKAFKKMRKQEADLPTNKEMFLISWCGMRGVVSLAMAFSIPFYIADGIEFPYRNLILFITFTVIIITLVFQGLLISPLIKLLGIEDTEAAREIKKQEYFLRLQLAEASLAYINTNYTNELQDSEPFRVIRDRYEHIIAFTKRNVADDNEDKFNERSLMSTQYHQMLVELVAVRRRELVSLRLNKKFDEELIKEKEYELDLEEARLRNTKN
ncbi:MAG: Na+/H+ antiporter [Niabella sp.]